MQAQRIWNLPAAMASLVAAVVVAACGGGGSTDTASGSNSGTATVASVSSGTITAFGSVYVNGRRYGTSGAKVIDDDTGAVATAGSNLEVGMVVDVKTASGGSGLSSTAEAAELHVHPLARGVVDASDTTASTLSVMGQSVQLTASTNYSDHRACATAATPTCTAVTSQADLTATSGSGSSATAGSYVAVHGYLYSASSGSAQIVATLVSVQDAPTSANFGYKVEGLVTAASGTSLTIGGLTVDLASATCKSSSTTVACSGAYSVGQVVSVGSATRPALPATSFTASRSRLASKIAVETDGATVELEGKVSAVGATSFVLRGVTVKASAIATLPAVGDIVQVSGTVTAGGQGVTATSVTVVRAASSRAYGLEGDFSAVVEVTAGSAYTVNVLGQTVTINTNTLLADRQSGTWSRVDPASNPFNITTFATYVAASASKHVLVKARTDAAGNLIAQSFTLLPTSAVATIAGPVDTTPAPVNSTVTGTPTTFSVHGVAVSADPAAVFTRRYGSGALTTTIAAGDTVVVRGVLVSGTLTVGTTPSRTNAVVDLGVLSRRDDCGI